MTQPSMQTADFLDNMKVPRSLIHAYFFSSWNKKYLALSQTVPEDGTRFDRGSHRSECTRGKKKQM